MNKIRLPLEDILAIVFVLVLFVGLIILGSIALTGEIAETRNESIAVRDPIDHTLILVKPMPIVETPWAFRHCTSTNKDCGRLE